MPIKILDPDTAMKIAAGEVIERPASVVKELIENCIDAGAGTIRVEIKNGGLAYMRVMDDGIGIAFEEVPVAFQRHATSKITEADDLYKLSTLGFRGEALPSIASVSQMLMLTRPRQNPTESGSEIAIEGGKIAYHRPAGAPVGTVITVRNLFYNLPARQKWSRSGTSEASYILTLINSYALAYPSIKWSLTSEGRTLLQTNGNGDLKDVMTKIYGVEVSQAVLAVGQVSSDALEAAFEDEKIKVKGYTVEPHISKPNRSFIVLFVNGRWVQSRILTYAVQEAYQSLLMTGRYPVSVLFVELEPSAVDVNVHPSKTEVRFLHERAVFSAVQKAVRAALVRGASVPVWDSPTTPSFTSPSAALAHQLFQNDGATNDQSNQEELKGWQLPMQSNDESALNLVGGNSAPDSPAPFVLQRNPASDPPDLTPDTRPLIAMKHRLPLLRVVGQISASFIVTEGQDGMYLIDQHAAHERIMYERFQAQLQGRLVESQLLLEPALIDLTPRQRLALQQPEKQTELADFGFQIEPFGEVTYLLRAVPSLLFGRDIAKALTEMLDEAEGLRDGGCGVATGDSLQEPDTILPRTWRDKLAASLACHSAIRAGQILNLNEMRELISQLEKVQYPRACAHGRPTLLYLSQNQLEKGFGRK